LKDKILWAWKSNWTEGGGKETSLNFAPQPQGASVNCFQHKKTGALDFECSQGVYGKLTLPSSLGVEIIDYMRGEVLRLQAEQPSKASRGILDGIKKGAADRLAGAEQAPDIREELESKANELSSGGTLHDDEGYIVLPPAKWEVLKDYFISFIKKT